MKKIFLSFLLLTGFQTMAQSAAEIINKFTAASNYKDGFTDFQISKTFKSNSNTDYTETVAIIAKDNKYWKKKSILERDFFYVLNGNAGWIKIPMGSRDKTPTYTIKDLNEKEKNDLQNEITDGYYPFVNFEAKSYKLTEEATADNSGTEALMKFSIERANIKRTYYFSKESGLLKKEIMVQNGITYTTDYNAWNETKSGVKFPSEADYFNTKDNKRTKVSYSLDTENIGKGISFVK